MVAAVWKLDEAKDVSELMQLRGDLRMRSKAAHLRELIAQGCVAMPGVPNASMARQVERAGFDAVYISGAGIANSTAGLPDIGLLTLTEVVRLAGYRANAVKIPAIVDADTGFGGAENVGTHDSRIGTRRAWLVVTSKIRNFRNVAVISPANRVVELSEMVGKNSKRPSPRNATRIF